MDRPEPTVPVVERPPAPAAATPPPLPAKRPVDHAEDDTGCPKHMVHGPCGGPRGDGTCEVGDRPCPFLGTALPRFDGDALDEVPPVPPLRVIADLRPDPSLTEEVAAAAALLAGTVDAVLVGEHLDDATPHAVPVVAEAVRSAGLDVVATLTCRQRTPDRAAADATALVDAGALAVHCVTGDHPRARLGLDQDPPFPLDSTRLTRVVAGVGAPASVAESPASPPGLDRVDRLLDKERAGATLGVLNHAGASSTTIGFVAEARRRGLRMPLLACVPVITDAHSARALDRFPGVVLPPGLIEEVLGAADPHDAGVARAVAIADELLDGGLDGVDLSGLGVTGALDERARVMAEVASGIGR